MAFLVVNAAMIPNEGTYRYHKCSAEHAREWLNTHWHEFESYVGYQQTADHLLELSGGHYVPLNRKKCEMQEGDEALVCKLAYRIDNPATKGQPQAEDWEYGILWRCDQNGFHCLTCANSVGECCGHTVGMA